MTKTINLGKAEFFTVEAFQFEFEDECFYEGERCEDVDHYWYEQLGGTLDGFVKEICDMNLTEDDHVIVRVIPRRWATIVDNEVEDYGDDCLGIESYIWNGKELVSEEEYTQELLHSYSEVTSGEL
jgi:hypothetical protein